MDFEKDIILFVNNEVLDVIKQCVKKAFPNEACGLIFGKIQEKQKPNSEAEYSYYYNGYEFECIESSRKSPVAFLMDDYNKLVEISRKYSNNYDYQLLSIFHSHPGNAHPSGVDIPYMERYYKSDISKFKYLIWTIMDRNCEELNGFIYIFDQLKQISIQIKKE